MSILHLAIFAFFAVLSGCAPETPSYSLLPVNGTVTLDGKPAANVEVDFQSTSGIQAHGTTDSSGAFTLQTPGHGEGVPAEVYTAKVRGPSVPKLYGEMGAKLVEVNSSQTAPVQIDLKSKVTAKDLGDSQTAEP